MFRRDQWPGIGQKLMLVCLLFLFFFPVDTLADQKVELDELFKKPKIWVDDFQVYILDSHTQVFHVYDAGTFAHKFQFGKKGEGPGEFQVRPYLFIIKDELCVASDGKCSYFSRAGELLREVKLTSGIYLQKPVGGNLVARQYIFDEKRKTNISQLNLFTGEGSKLLTIHTEETKQEGSNGSKKTPWDVLPKILRFQTNGTQVIIADQNEGSVFQLFDFKGNKLREFSLDSQPMKVGKRDIQRHLDDFRDSVGLGFYKSHLERFVFVTPEYYPPFDNFVVDGETIYIYGHQVKHRLKELHVLDFSGNRLLKSEVTGGYSDTFHNFTHFYLIENAESEEWEIHIRKLKGAEGGD